MKVAIGSDHAGFESKENIRRFLADQGIQVEDIGTNSKESVDYPDYAQKVSGLVQEGKVDYGILICSTGVGMCMAANKIHGIRAAQAWAPDIARLSRQHNNANVLCLAGKFLERETAQEIVKTFLNSSFDGGRHERRVGKMMELECHS
jgi:ribose 5-phosphate isomerase B